MKRLAMLVLLLSVLTGMSADGSVTERDYFGGPPICC